MSADPQDTMTDRGVAEEVRRLTLSAGNDWPVYLILRDRALYCDLVRAGIALGRRSGPVTRGPTDVELKALVEEVRKEARMRRLWHEDRELSDDEPFADDHDEMLRTMLRTALARYSDPDAVRRARVEGARELAHEINDWIARWHPHGSAVDELRRIVARVLIPAPPAAPPCVTLSDGSVVEVMRNIAGNVRLIRHNGDGDPNKECPLTVPRDWRGLTRDTDTGADFDALKALAATVTRRAE